MLTRLPLSLMVELAVDCNTKYSVPSALMKSGDGFSSAIRICLPEKHYIGTILPQKLQTAGAHRQHAGRPGAAGTAALMLVDQGEFAGRVRAGQGRERGRDFVELERLRHGHDQV